MLFLFPSIKIVSLEDMIVLSERLKNIIFTNTDLNRLIVIYIYHNILSNDFVFDPKTFVVYNKEIFNSVLI